MSAHGLDEREPDHLHSDSQFPNRPTMPSTARMYNYFLGGKDHYKCDRTAAEEVIAADPSIPQIAKDNRAFLIRATRYCAEQHIHQFVDVGTGIPTSPNVAEVARDIHPDAVVVGIDNDPVVLAHQKALVPGMQLIDGDIRQPAAVVTDPDLNSWIDWSKPVAVLFVAVLPFITDEQDPFGIVRMFRDRMAPGSLIVISHGSSSGADPESLAKVERVYQRATSPAVSRSQEQILRFFDGFDLVPPGLVLVQNWPHPIRPVPTFRLVGGIGRKPETAAV